MDPKLTFELARLEHAQSIEDMRRESSIDLSARIGLGIGGVSALLAAGLGFAARAHLRAKREAVDAADAGAAIDARQGAGRPGVSPGTAPALAPRPASSS